MAEIAEKELESFVVSSPSYVKDTTNFFNKVQQTGAVTDQTILFTMGVVKLYPSIQQKEGIQPCREGLNLTIKSEHSDRSSNSDDTACIGEQHIWLQ